MCSQQGLQVPDGHGTGQDGQNACRKHLPGVLVALSHEGAERQACSCGHAGRDGVSSAGSARPCRLVLHAPIMGRRANIPLLTESQETADALVGPPHE